MYDMLSDHVERVELANPKEVKAIANAAVKTDRIGAKSLIWSKNGDLCSFTKKILNF
jgi:hypothetical protein